jgi:hypothetical protein
MSGTVNVVTSALEKAPYWSKVLGESDWELSCASSRWIDYMNVAPEIEDQHIREAVASLQKVRGDKKAPLGRSDTGQAGHISDRCRLLCRSTLQLLSAPLRPGLQRPRCASSLLV